MEGNSQLTSLGNSLRSFLRRIRGISTPLGGISWAPNDNATEERAESGDGSLVLTPGECAGVLQVEERLVLEMLESGELQGFKVGDEWRITSPSLVQFLKERSRETAFEVFAKQISNPKIWARELRRQPEFAEEIRQGMFPDDSFGKFLQNALGEVDRHTNTADGTD